MSIQRWLGMIASVWAKPELSLNRVVENGAAVREVQNPIENIAL
jgi:hypothetical protein